MNKSIYSLLLLDEVVEEIDKLAYETNSSRSALVNRILADYVSCTTPEQRMQSIFEQIQSFFDESEIFHLIPQPSEAMMTMRTALSFKYSPSIRYSVELYRSRKPAAGILRVAARTQYEALLYELTCFFEAWMGIETEYGIDESFSAFSGGHYARELYPADELSDAETADAIADYIKLLDRSIKTYFKLLPVREDARRSVTETYGKAYSEGRILI
jgi:hypothetical protein